MSAADLLSPLPRAECVRRLRQAVGSEWALIGTGGVVGKVADDTFRIHKRIYYRNSFQKFLYGHLSDAPGGGTAIHCEARELDLMWVFILAGVVAAVAGIGVLTAFSRQHIAWHAVPLPALIGPVLVIPLLIAIGFGTVMFGRYAARNEQAYLLDFLKRTLDAKEV